MKTLLIGLLALGSLSSFADDYRDCSAIALEIAKEATEKNCEEKFGYPADSHEIVSIHPLHEHLEGTMAQITYYCEAGQGIIVLLQDNRGDKKRKKLLCKKGFAQIMHVGAWE
jgi:hypothetical protein